MKKAIILTLLAFSAVSCGVMSYGTTESKVASYDEYTTNSGSMTKSQAFAISDMYIYTHYVNHTMTAYGDYWSLVFKTQDAISATSSYVEIGYETICDMIGAYAKLEEALEKDLGVNAGYLENLYELNGINLSIGYYISSGYPTWVCLYNPDEINLKTARDYPGRATGYYATPEVMLSMLNAAKEKIESLFTTEVE